MRHLILTLVLCLSAAPALARDCVAEVPRFPRTASDLLDAIACLDAEIRALRLERARLEARVAEQAAALAEVPVAYLNEDGRENVEEDRPLSSARFVLTARQTGGAASLPVERTVLAALCARPGGCRLTLLQRLSGFGQPTPDTATGVGPCAFHYDPAGGAWFRGAGCGETDERQGVDGGGSAARPEQGREIASVGGGCLLADADIDLRPESPLEPLGRDTGRGLFLVAAPALGPGAGARFRCELTLD
jgi:hypothetical protein